MDRLRSHLHCKGLRRFGSRTTELCPSTLAKPERGIRRQHVGLRCAPCFSIFPFVLSDLCVDARLTVFQGVRPTVTSSPGQSQATRSLRAGLLGPSLSPLPVQPSRPSPPIRTSSGLPSTDPRPHGRGSVPSVCQQGYYFSTPEIQAR